MSYWYGDAPYIADMEKKRLLTRKRRRAALASARTRAHNKGDHSKCLKTADCRKDI